MLICFLDSVKDELAFAPLKDGARNFCSGANRAWRMKAFNAASIFLAESEKAINLACL